MFHNIKRIRSRLVEEEKIVANACALERVEKKRKTCFKREIVNTPQKNKQTQ